MSDELNRPREHEDEVEAHSQIRKGENTEAADETESDDEVEAHGHPKLGAPKNA